jgi:serine/threonine-protein kinase RsbW
MRGPGRSSQACIFFDCEYIVFVHKADRVDCRDGPVDLTDSTANRVSMTLDSVLGSVEIVEQTAEAFALRAGFEEDDASQIAMVSREAAVNAIVHGNQYDAAKHVNASFEITDEALNIQIEDEGQGVDVEKIPDPLTPENVMRSSGRGIFLMRAIMDEVHFQKLNPGTRLKLVKLRFQKEIHP